VDLGEVDGPEVLRRRLDALAGPTTASRSADSASPELQASGPDCSEAAVQRAAGRPLELRATLRYQGTPATAFVFGAGGTGAGRAVVVDAATCEVLYAGPR
jgi:hypothetical protein